MGLSARACVSLAVCALLLVCPVDAHHPSKADLAKAKKKLDSEKKDKHSSKDDKHSSKDDKDDKHDKHAKDNKRSSSSSRRQGRGAQHAVGSPSSTDGLMDMDKYKNLVGGEVPGFHQTMQAGTTTSGLMEPAANTDMMGVAAPGDSQVGTPADPAAGGQDATASAAGAAEVPEMSEPEDAASAEADEADEAEEEANEEEDAATPFELDVGMLAVSVLLIVACVAMVMRLCKSEINKTQTLEDKYQQLRKDRLRAAVYSKP